MENYKCPECGNVWVLQENHGLTSINCSECGCKITLNPPVSPKSKYKCTCCGKIYTIKDSSVPTEIRCECGVRVTVNALVNAPVRELICSESDNQKTPEALPEISISHYCHKKSGNVYLVTGKVVDCTNVTDGRIMVAYQREGKHYVREEREFHEKFIKLVYDKPPMDSPIARTFDKSTM